MLNDFEVVFMIYYDFYYFLNKKSIENQLIFNGIAPPPPVGVGVGLG